MALHGIDPGDPYPLLDLILDKTNFKRPSPARRSTWCARSGRDLVPPKPPPQEHLPAWRQRAENVPPLRPRDQRAAVDAAFAQQRDADAIHHHYDVSNTFYEYVLGPSMTYTCALYPTDDATLEEAQAAKYDLICRKLGLEPGMRLLDIGCGWGGMVRHAAKHYGVKALGVTLSREQANWAQKAIKADRLDDVAEVRFSDYRDVVEGTSTRSAPSGSPSTSAWPTTRPTSA